MPPGHESREESEKKEELLRKIDKIIRYRTPPVPVVVLFVIISYFILRPYPAFYTVSSILIVSSAAILPVLYFIKKESKSLNIKTIHLILTSCYTGETIGILFVFYLWRPILIYYLGGGIVFMLGLAFLTYIISTIPIYDSKKYAYYFFSLVVSVLIIFGLLEYLGIYPVYPNYPVEHLYHTNQIVPLLLSSLIVISLITILQFRFQSFWDMFRKQSYELKEFNKSLDQKIKERTRQLEEAKSELEIKVEERTKDLDEKIEELEKFRKLSIGRELKMIELKKRIDELESGTTRNKNDK